MPLLLILGALMGGGLLLASRRPHEGVDLFTSTVDPGAAPPQPPAVAPGPNPWMEAITVQPTGGRKYIHPLANAPFRVTSPFGPRTNPVTGLYQSLHNGLDLSAPSGTPIYAVDSGRVEKIWLGDATNGNAVKIRHNDGWSTAYLHMVESPLVRQGEVVSKGQMIGRVGMTGRATGNHLHFITYSAAGAPTDPRPITDPSPWAPSRGTTSSAIT